MTTVNNAVSTKTVLAEALERAVEAEKNNDRHAGMPKATAEADMISMPREGMETIYEQAANSAQYFMINNLAWFAGMLKPGFGTHVTVEDVRAAKAQIYIVDDLVTDGGDTRTVEGVDKPVEDLDGREDVRSDPQMDSGTDTRRRVSEKQLKSLHDNANRYLDNKANLKRLAEYGFSPTQPLKDSRGTDGKTVEGIVTTVIKRYNNQQDANRAKWEREQQAKYGATASAAADFAAADDGEF